MKIKSLLLSVLALSAFVACQEKQTILTPSQVSLDPLILKVTADGETKAAALTANCEWEVSAPSWVTVAPESGNGSTTLSIIVAANDGKERDGEVTIVAKDAKSSAKLLVYQAGKAEEPNPDDPPTPPTPEDPTVLKTAEQLLNFISEAPTLTAEEEYSLGADIDCGGAKISPIPSFAAILDGKGHKVYNFSVESTDAKSGLVLLNTGTIKNIVFGSSDGKTYDGKSSISAVEGAGGDFAGLIADNAGVLENVTTFVTINYVAGTEKPADYIGVGGIAGTASAAGSFVNCTNYATINAEGTLTQEIGIGGILGYTKSSEVTLTSCVNAANLTFTIPVAKVVMIGGIAGRTNGTSNVLDDYAKIFDRTNKKNNEIIFSLALSASNTGGYQIYFCNPSNLIASAYRNNPVPISSTQWWSYSQGFVDILKASEAKGDKRVATNLGYGPYSSAADHHEITWCNKLTGDMSKSPVVQDNDLIYYRYGYVVMLDAELKYYKKDYAGANKALPIPQER